MRRQIPLGILLLIACDVLLAVAYLLTRFMGPQCIADMFDLDSEANIPAWYSSMQWLVAATAFAVFAGQNARSRVVWSWPLLLLPAIFVLFSIDESAQIHETLGKISDALLKKGQREHTALHATGLWIFVIGIPAIAFLTWAMAAVRMYLAETKTAWRMLCLGMITLLGGAVGLESLSNLIRGGSALAIAEITAEELMEMVGSTLVCWAGVELLCENEFRIQMRRATPQRKKQSTIMR